MSVEELVARLDAKRSGNGWQARCPAHDDTSPSLSINLGDDGRILLHCFAGCQVDAICDALGISMKALSPNTRTTTQFTKDDAVRALRQRGLRAATIAYFHIDFDHQKRAYGFPLGRGKGRKWKAVNSNGTAKFWTERGTKATTYHLEPCHHKTDVWLVEGEPDCWIAHQAGVAAFAFSSGAGTVPDGAIDEIKRADIGTVHIVYDNDEAGRDGTAKVAGAFCKAGITHTVRQLPASVGPGGDITTLYNAVECDDDRFITTLENLPHVDHRTTDAGDSEDSEDCDLESQEWPAPVPLSTFEPPPFPVDALPYWVACFVRELAEATQTPPDLAGTLALGALAATVAGKAEIEVKPGYREPLNLFVVTALPPANRKSAVFDAVIQPIQEFEQQERSRLGPAIEAERTAYNVLKRRVGEAEKTASRGGIDKSEEQLATARRLAQEFYGTPEPVLPRFICDDCTPEKLSDLLREQGGRMAVFSPEGDVFEIMAGRYSRAGLPNFTVYNKGHAGDTLYVDRLGRPGEFVPRPALTMALAVQPEVIRELAWKRGFRGRGLLGRMLYSMPKSPVGRRKTGRAASPVSGDAREEYRLGVCYLLRLAAAKDESGERTVHVLTLGKDAEAAMWEFEADIERRLARADDLGPIDDWAGKLVGAVARITGLFHLAANVARPDQWTLEIDVAAVRGAIEVGRYFISHAKAAYQLMGTNVNVEGAKHLLAWLEQREPADTFSAREAFQALRGRFTTMSEFTPCLEPLVEHGYIRPIDVPHQRRRGRPRSPRYEVHPHLLDQNPRNSQKGHSENCENNEGHA